MACELNCLNALAQKSLAAFRVTESRFAVIATMMNPNDNKNTAFVAVVSYILGNVPTTNVVGGRETVGGDHRGTILNRNRR